MENSFLFTKARQSIDILRAKINPSEWKELDQILSVVQQYEFMIFQEGPSPNIETPDNIKV